MNVLSSCLGLRRTDHAGSVPVQTEESERYRDVSDEKKGTFTVLVTGMGAFPNPGDPSHPQYTENDNTSHLITTLLPSSLPPFSTHNPTSTHIKILNPTSFPGCAVKTEYAFVRRYCKQLWKEHGNEVDLILHLGMADGWEWYTIERSAWKQGTIKSVDLGNGRQSQPLEYYTVPDDIGQIVVDAGVCPWGDDVPERLLAGPGFDIERMAKDVERVLEKKPKEEAWDGVEVRPHPDAGNYLCGFISYESLARRFVGGYKAKMLFCHMPSWKDEQRLGVGRDFVCGLIANIAAQDH